MEKAADLKKLGVFTNKTGSMWVSDPCYSPGTWCQGRMENVATGNWSGLVQKSDKGVWGIRVARLFAIHESQLDTIIEDGDWHEARMTVGVDSGQCGFFDGDIEIGSGEYGEAGTFYGDCCDATLGEESAGLIDGRGVVSSSGYGDGTYPCHFVRDDTGKIVAVCLTFIGEEDEDEDEEEVECAVEEEDEE